MLCCRINCIIVFCIVKSSFLLSKTMCFDWFRSGEGSDSSIWDSIAWFCRFDRFCFFINVYVHGFMILVNLRSVRFAFILRSCSLWLANISVKRKSIWSVELENVLIGKSCLFSMFMHTTSWNLRLHRMCFLYCPGWSSGLCSNWWVFDGQSNSIFNCSPFYNCYVDGLQWEF